MKVNGIECTYRKPYFHLWRLFWQKRFGKYYEEKKDKKTGKVKNNWQKNFYWTTPIYLILMFPAIAFLTMIAIVGLLGADSLFLNSITSVAPQLADQLSEKYELFLLNPQGSANFVIYLNSQWYWFENVFFQEIDSNSIELWRETLKSLLEINNLSFFSSITVFMNNFSFYMSTFSPVLGIFLILTGSFDLLYIIGMLIRFNVGYFRMYRRAFKEEWGWIAEQAALERKIKHRDALWNYERYQQTLKTPGRQTYAVFLDDELYKEIGGNPSSGGWTIRTFITNKRSDIDFILKNRFLPKHIWEQEDSSIIIADFNIFKNEEDEVSANLEELKKNLEVFKGTPSTPASVLEECLEKINKEKARIKPTLDKISEKKQKWFEEHKFGVVISWGTHAIVEGATGGGKGESDVWPGLLASMGSIQRPSILFTFKTEKLEYLEYYTNHRNYEYWKMSYDRPNTVAHYNPISLMFTYNKLYRQLAFGKPEHITEYTPFDFENSFTIRWSTPGTKLHFEKTALLTKKDVLDFIDNFDKEYDKEYSIENSIFNFEKLKGWEEMTSYNFCISLKHYKSNALKILNTENPFPWYKQGTFPIWNSPLPNSVILKKQAVKDWYRVGNFVYETLEDYYNDLSNRKIDMQEKQKTLGADLIALVLKFDPTQAGDKNDIWKQFAQKIFVSLINFYLEMANYSPLFCEEYFNLPSISLWLNTFKNTDGPEGPENEWIEFWEFMDSKVEKGIFEPFESYPPAKEIYGQAQQTWSSSLSSLTGALTTYSAGQSLSNIILRDDINPFTFSYRPTLMAISPSQDPTSVQNQIIPLLLTTTESASAAIMNENIVNDQRKCPNPTLYLLDEAGSGFPPPKKLITNITSLGRSAGKFIALYYQNIYQIDEAKYPGQSEALRKEIFANSYLKKCVHSNAKTDAELWSQEFGNYRGSKISHQGQKKDFDQDRKWKSTTGGYSVEILPVFAIEEILKKPVQTIVGKFFDNIYLMSSPFLYQADAMDKWNKKWKEQSKKGSKEVFPLKVSYDDWKDDYYLDIFAAVKEYVAEQGESNKKQRLIDNHFPSFKIFLDNSIKKVKFNYLMVDAFPQEPKVEIEEETPEIFDLKVEEIEDKFEETVNNLLEGFEGFVPTSNNVDITQKTIISETIKDFVDDSTELEEAFNILKIKDEKLKEEIIDLSSLTIDNKVALINQDFSATFKIETDYINEETLSFDNNETFDLFIDALNSIPVEDKIENEIEIEKNTENLKTEILEDDENW
ncbi:MAG: TraM recognition domain-containing protein [Mycoplasma sp.]